MGWYDGTEADYLDDGGDYVDDWKDDIEYDTDYIRKQKIIDDRRYRERELIGKYLVVVNSRYQSNLNLFLQDSKYGNGHWTKFRSNAKGFYDESAAIIKAKNLQFNNPRVVFVQANGKLKEVYNSGERTR